MKKMILVLVLFVQQMNFASFDYKKIPLCLGSMVVIGSGLLARDIYKHNNLVLQAWDQLHQLKTGCGVLSCETKHDIVDLSNLTSNQKRSRCGIYNNWYYQNKGKLAASAGHIWHAVTHVGENVYSCYENVQLLPEKFVQDVFEKTLENALEATIFRSYNQAVLGASVGALCFGTYFYLKYKK